MATPHGFDWTLYGENVVITHHGRPATTLRGRRALDFQADVEGGTAADAQELMARLTGNYRRGNERTAREHPRNRVR